MAAEQGDLFVAEAKKSLQKNSWFFGPSKEDKIAEAIDYYVKAASQYKIVKLWENAGSSYIEAGKLGLGLPNNSYYTATNFSKAGEVLIKNDMKTNIALAIYAFENAVKLFVDNGHLIQAAANNLKIAEIKEENGMLVEAISSYEKTYDYYEAEHQQSHSIKILLKIANLLIEINDYHKAIIIFEKIANYYIKSQTSCLVSTYKTYLCKACICKLYLDDIVDMKKTLNKYCCMKDGFVNTEEYILIDNLINAYEQSDPEYFVKILNNSNYKFQKWELKIVDSIKDKLIKENLEEDFT